MEKTILGYPMFEYLLTIFISILGIWIGWNYDKILKFFDNLFYNNLYLLGQDKEGKFLYYNRVLEINFNNKRYVLRKKTIKILRDSEKRDKTNGL